MKKLNISISLNLKYSSLQTATDLEQKYQVIYKNIATFFYQYSLNHINIFFPGSLLLWIEQTHPEFTKLFTKMVSRRQIEILGGGFYEPLLPTIFPLDRSGQLEYLTSEIRRIFGKRPRGAVLFDSVWENSLVPSLQNGGMEYVLLDNSLVPNRSPFVPYILNEKGKSIKILLNDDKLSPEVSIEPEDYIKKLLSKSNFDNEPLELPFSETATFNDFDNTFDHSFENIVSINIDENQFKLLHDSGWLEKFYSLCRTEFADSINIVHPLDYFNENDEFVQIYISSGINSKYELPTIFDYLYSNSRSKALYNRMLHISMLLSQCKGDKSRRNTARENLWIAQSSEAYLYDKSNDKAAFSNAKIRQYAYRNLLEAEKMIREANEYSESISTYDYDGDGHDEYICSMEKFNACISLKSAQICELNVMKSSGNYADNENERGFFLSYLFDEKQFKRYKNNHFLENTISSNVFYKRLFDEVSFHSSRKELKLLGMGNFVTEVESDKGNTFKRNPVSIIKKYVANSNGFMVQFILKNESQEPITGHLVVECNFAQMDFSLPECNSYKVEIIHGEDYTSEKTIVSDGTEISDNENLGKSISLSNVSFIQLTDTYNDVSFVYEPNEVCDVICTPISSKRGTTFIASLCWNVDLLGGLEMEKTVNFAIVTPRKRRK